MVSLYMRPKTVRSSRSPMAGVILTRVPRLMTRRLLPECMITGDSMNNLVLTKYLDCDNRRKAKTDLFCCCCNKDIKPGSKYRMVHWIDGGPFILHPDSESFYISDGGDMGSFPIGMTCAKKLGLEWTHDISKVTETK
jgi:hypothetical protein